LTLIGGVLHPRGPARAEATTLRRHAGGDHTFPVRRVGAVCRGAGLRRVAGEVLPLPVFPYRRLRIQGDQGRGGLVRLQARCIRLVVLRL
jgi:hypothetical protein